MAFSQHNSELLASLFVLIVAICFEIACATMVCNEPQTKTVFAPILQSVAGYIVAELSHIRKIGF